jgi:glycosyltransferase involved in cell wall biosynthesis
VEQASARAGIPIVFSDDLPQDLAGASAFVYISRSEGLGSAALLAMSMGVPVVASRVGGLMEVFEDGVSGISVENDAEAIANAIRRVRSDAALAGRLMEAARIRVETMFSKEQLAKNTVASYRRAIAG